MIRGLTIAVACVNTLSAVAQDRIPRDRLVSTPEMIFALDRSIPEFSDLEKALLRGNTSAVAKNLLNHLRTRVSPRYFFNPSEARERSHRFAGRYAVDQEATEKDVLAFMKRYGTDVDWKLPGKDLKGRAHTPNTIRLLARQLYAENVAVLYYTRGSDRQFIDFQMGQWRDFINDVEAGRVETGGNDVFERFYCGHRVRSWTMFHQLLLHSDALTPDDHLFIVKSFLLHGARLIDQSRKFNWGNHQLVGLCALFEMSLMHPEFPVMRQWNEQALKLILEHLEKEVAQDGFQFERASHYFKLDIYNYFRFFRLAEENGVQLPAWARPRLHAMFRAILAVLMPNGAMPPLQDAQDTYIGSRNIEEARNRLTLSETSNSAELVDPAEGPFLALGAYLFKDPELKGFGSPDLHSAFWWYLPEQANDEYRALPAVKPTFGSIALKSTGYYIMRSGWGGDATYLIIDGGRAVEKPDHTHGGVLGVVGFTGGQMVLPNYRVRYSDPSYSYLKNSWVKNVALADSIMQGRGWIPNAARTGFGKWAWLPTPTVTTWITGETNDIFSATHDGFDTVDVRYTRSIVFLKPYGWVVSDAFISGTGVHTAQQVWQGAYTIVAQHHARLKAGHQTLDIRQALTTGVSATIGGGHGTQSVIFRTEKAKAHRFVTAILPSPVGTKTPVRVEAWGSNGVRLRRADTTDLVSFSGPKGIVARGVTSDARVVVTRTVSGRMVGFSASNVSHFDGGGVAMQSETPLDIELTRNSGEEWTGRQHGGQPARVTFTNNKGASAVLQTTPDTQFSVRW